MSYGSIVVARRLSDVKIPHTIAVAGPVSLNEARNLGAAGLRTKFIAFIDDDNTLASDALDKMAEAFTDDKIGAVAPLTFDSAGKVWFAGVKWTRFGMASINKTIPEGYRDTECFHNVFMVRRKAFEEAGGFNAERHPFYLGEADLAEKMKRLGYRFVVTPEAKVWHEIETGMARGSHIRTEKRAYLVGRNRLLWLKTYYPWRFVAHLFILPALAAYHIAGMIADGHSSFVKQYLKGVLDGL